MPYDAQTLPQLFWNGVRTNSGKTAQEWFDGNAWQARTYGEFGQAVRETAHALLSVGLKKGERVALWSRNSPQWAEVDLANLSLGLVTVPIYDTLTAEKGGFILKDSGARVLFVQDETILARVQKVRKTLPALDLVVVLHGDVPAGAGKGVESHAQFIARGRERLRAKGDELDGRIAAVKAADLASLVYTSGTTGEPKGVMLTHGNFTSNATTAMNVIDLGPTDVFLSFLPLSHVFERLAGHFCAYGCGATVVFARSLETLPDDMVRARPTLMMAVPRLYEKMHARVLEKVAGESRLKRGIFAWAMKAGLECVPYRERNEAPPRGLARRRKLADRLVLHKIRDRVGGRLRFFISGGAALSPAIERFFWAAGVSILQGYGLTETSPVTNVNTPTSLRIGSVGRTIPGVELRIDTQGWEGTGPPSRQEGEICFKGPNVMQGYWRNEKATAEAFDAAGWFHTGDVGYVDADGFLFITDRKKEILVLSNGKKVAPQPIENLLSLQPHVGQACVVGERRNFVGALLVPNWPAVEKFALQNGIATADRAKLLHDPRVASLFDREVAAVNEGLSRYEQIKRFELVPTEWSVESGELTPTLKLKRRIIQERLGGAIDGLYSKAGAEAA
jgi:long-chain acyl-CoA synthetase